MVKKSLKRIVTSIVTFLITGLVLIFVTNEIIFNSNIPESLEADVWTGKWRSKKAKLIGGKIVAKIPKGSEENVSDKDKALIYYDIWSVYRPGQIEIGEIEALFGSKNLIGSEKLPDIPLEDIDEISSFFFKANLRFTDNQEMVLTGIKRMDKDEIYGTYISNFAATFGKFKLKADH